MPGQIPKVIHFCWFGGNPYPPLVEYCMASWKKHLPDYEIREWNETNFDVNENQYVREAYESKKWAFVTDYVRLYALYQYGGIYMDSDVEVLRSIDPFLSQEAFSGFEARDTVPTAIMGSQKGQMVMGQLLRDYDHRRFILQDGRLDTTTNTSVITDFFISRGIVLNGEKQTIDGFTMYPQSMFCPNTLTRVFNAKPKGAYTIHHSMGSWGETPKYRRSFPARVKRYLVGWVRNIAGSSVFAGIKRNTEK